MCLENILHLFKYLPRLQRITICRFTTRFTKNCNLQGFKELYLTTFHLDLCLICWFTSLRALFLWTSGNVTSIVSITHTVIFSKQEVLRRRAARGSSWENKCSWNNGKIEQLKLNFFSKYVVRNNEKEHCSFKNSDK